MDMEQYFTADMTLNDPHEKDGISLEKPNSFSDTVDLTENNLTGGFDCNICLDMVQDPVITLCGHLYCWPCIYKWIHYPSVSAENQDHQQPQCPVCKAEITEKTLVPLYGHGQTAKASDDKVSRADLVIPQRPSSPQCGFHHQPISPTRMTGWRPAQHLQHRNYPQLYYPRTGNVVHPTMNMFGEMVYARIFGNLDNTLYAYPNSYDLAGSNIPRVRRHLMLADKSLGRFCFFLFCCMILCLLLF